MSETLRVTKQAGVTMVVRPKLALPVLAAAAVGYVFDAISDAAQKAMVRSWAGGLAGGSVLASQGSHGLATFSRGQMLALEVVVRGGFALAGMICYALALVATVRMMRRDGEVASGIPWRGAFVLAALLCVLGAASNAILVVLVTQLDGIVSADAMRSVSAIGGVLLTMAIFWVLAPRSVRLAATQGGRLQANTENAGQRVAVLTAVLTALLAAINNVTAQFTYAHMDATKAKLVSLGWLLLGALPVVVLVIGFGLLTSKEDENQPGVRRR